MNDKNLKLNIYENLSGTLETECRLLAGVLSGCDYTPDPQSDWEEIYSDLYAQTSETLAGDYIGSLPISAELKTQWKTQCMKRINRFYQIIEAQDRLVSVLGSHGIKFAILKGCAAAMYYPRPQYRVMGDVDFLVEPERFDEAAALLAENGFADGNSEFNRHEVFYINGVEFEMHRYFSLNGGSDELKELDTVFFDGLNHTENRDIEGHVFPVLPPLPNGLILLQHIRHHLHRSLGMRQITDWMMFVSQELDDAKWAEFKAETDKAGLTQLALTVTRMCQLYLGLDNSIKWCRAADDRLCVQLFAHVAMSGNMGRKRKADKVQAQIDRSRGFFNTFRHLQRDGLNGWEAAKKHKILRCLAWLWQIIHYLSVAVKNKISIKTIISSGQNSRNADRMFEALGCSEDFTGE